MTHFLLKIDPKSSLQSGTVLFSDSWWGISTGIISGHSLEKVSIHFHRSSRVLGVTKAIKPQISMHFFQHEELQNSEKSFYGKRT